MNRYSFFVAALAVFLAACGEREPADSPEAAAPAQEPVAQEAAAPQQAEVTEAFLNHMHLHADQLDKLNYALDDGDLWGAMTPAYWLSRHETVEGIPDEWQVHSANMRQAAFEVESSTRIENARAAAAKISAACQGCHEAAGVNAGGG
jgi:hypothetical protein